MLPKIHILSNFGKAPIVTINGMGIPIYEISTTLNGDTIPVVTLTIPADIEIEGNFVIRERKMDDGKKE